MRVTRTRATTERGPRRTARAWRSGRPVPGAVFMPFPPARADSQGLADLGHREPVARGQDLGHLRGEGGGGHDDLGGRAVRDDLAVGQDDHAVGQLGGQLHVVGGQDDGVALGREAAQDRRSGGPWRRSRGRGSARRGAAAAGGPSARAPGRGPGAGPRRGHGGGCRPGRRAAAARPGHGRCREPRRRRGRRRRTRRPPCRRRGGRGVPGGRGRRGGSARAGPCGAGPPRPPGPCRWRADQADEGGEEGGLAGAVAAHQGDDLAGPDREVDVAQRLDAPPPHREPRDLGDGGHLGLLAGAAQRGPAGGGGGSGRGCS